MKTGTLLGKGNNDGLAMFLRYDGLKCEIIEGRMRHKPTRGRRRNQMLHD